jgi:RsiW-degrading membrane proteinase PrsW (M82 family)
VTAVHVEPLAARAQASEDSGAKAFRLIQVHNPAFWLYAWLVINGAFVYIQGFSTAAVRPSAFVIAIVLEVLFTLPFWWFITKRDRFDREPAKLAVVGFLWGGLVATWLMAAPANGAILSLWSKVVSVDFATSWGPALTAPFTEETSKYAGLVVLVLLSHRHIRSAYDGMILGAFVGLGFQVFENVQYIVSGIETNYNQNPAQHAVQVFFLRSVTGLWSHAVYSAIAGAGLGYFVGAKHKSRGRRFAVAIGMLLLAMVVHSCLDAAVAQPGLIALSPIVTLTAVVLTWRFATRGERQWIATLLHDEVANGVLSQAELDVVAGDGKASKHYIAGIKKANGKAAAKRAEHVIDAAYDLAAAHASTEDPTSDAVAYARSELIRVRGLAQVPAGTRVM